MKRTLMITALLIGALVSGWAQDPDSRDKSRYAVNNFENDDIYTAVQTYDPVSVAQPKGRKVKNVILMNGSGTAKCRLGREWTTSQHYGQLSLYRYTVDLFGKQAGDRFGCSRNRTCDRFQDK